MEDQSQYLMWMKRKQMLKSHLQAPILGACNINTNSWEERAFAEDADRILRVRGYIWPPRSYSCNFCKREFRSAQALGGHMNVHRRDRARLKQSLASHNEALQFHHDHKIDCKSLGSHDQFSSENCSQYSQLDCCLNSYSSPAVTTVTTSTLLSSRPSSLSTQENSSSISEPKGLVNAREENFKGLGCNDYVETSLSVGLNPVFGQKLPIGPCGEEAISCKRPKTYFSSMPVFLKPCSNDRCLAFQSSEFVPGVKPGMEDLDLELRLGKPQKVK